MFDDHTDLSGSYVPYELTPPDEWPRLLSWVKLCRKNAISVFPSSVYNQFRSDHQSFGRRLSVVSDPKSIQMICGKNSNNYRLTNLHLRMLSPSLGEGLIVAEGDAWRKQRRVAVPRGHKKNYRKHDNLINERISVFVDALPINQSTYLLDELCLLALDLIGHGFFGLKRPIATPAVLRLIADHRNEIERVDWFDVFGIPPQFKTSKMISAKRIADQLDDEIQQGIAEWQNDNQIPSINDHHLNLRDFAVSILAGFESIAVTVNWAMALLAKKQKYISLIRAENTDLSYSPYVDADTKRPALHRVLHETLRLYPPLPLIYRTCIADDTLPVGEIKQGTIVCLSPWVVHRNNKNWSAPNCFDPERWSQLEVPKAFMPFGIGGRQCIGMHFGYELCAKVIMAVLSRFAPKIKSEAELFPRAGVSLRPAQPIALKFEPVAC